MEQTRDVTITYLQQTDKPSFAAIAKPHGQTAILRVLEPPIHYYRYLYDVVGSSYYWSSRKLLTDDALIQVIHDPNTYIYVLYMNGSPAGFSEFDRRDPQDVEIKFFGLAPEFTGKGLSRWFLAQILDLIWGFAPKRVRLETCTLDHPAALPLYQKMGFTVFDQRKGSIDVSG